MSLIVVDLDLHRFAGLSNIFNFWEVDLYYSLTLQLISRHLQGFLFGKTNSIFHKNFIKIGLSGFFQNSEKACLGSRFSETILYHSKGKLWNISQICELNRYQTISSPICFWRCVVSCIKMLKFNSCGKSRKYPAQVWVPKTVEGYMYFCVFSSQDVFSRSSGSVS